MALEKIKNNRQVGKMESRWHQEKLKEAEAKREAKKYKKDGAAEESKSKEGKAKTVAEIDGPAPGFNEIYADKLAMTKRKELAKKARTD